MTRKTYIAIDLKSFYASVECIERKLNPLTTNLVVADSSRTEKTICLAVSPTMKAYGIPGRARLFEVVQKIKEENVKRKQRAPRKSFSSSSYNDVELKKSPELSIDYIIAPPRMALYIEYSTKIYNTYLKYIAKEDIHVYSIDEVFMDVTNYLNSYKLSARELAMKMILDVLETSGITATAGIGTNLFLCKVAMDIQAKHIEADSNGVRIAELDELSYRKLLWTHKPLIDFWRIGRGYSKKLEALGLYTMGDIARCSLGKANEYHNEELLYKTFGINAELLIDHAWGYEPCTIADVKSYKPESSSLGSGQVLHCPYDFHKAKIIAREMTEQIVFDLVEKKLVTDQIVITVGYDKDNLNTTEKQMNYLGQVTKDYYGRTIPKAAHGTSSLTKYSSSSKILCEAAMNLFDKIVDKNLLIRRIYVTVNHTLDEKEAKKLNAKKIEHDLFTDIEEEKESIIKENAKLEREKRQQLAVLEIKKKFGKNAILKGTDLEEGSTTKERNNEIGGHKA